MGSVERDAQLTGTWKKRHPLLTDVRRRPLLYLMVLPAVAGIVLFRYLPAYNMVIAFQNFNLLDGVWGSDWVGLKWFLKFFRDPFFFRLVRNTTPDSPDQRLCYTYARGDSENRVTRT